MRGKSDLGRAPRQLRWSHIGCDLHAVFITLALLDFMSRSSAVRVEQGLRGTVSEPFRTQDNPFQRTLHGARAAKANKEAEAAELAAKGAHSVTYKYIKTHKKTCVDSTWTLLRRKQQAAD